MPGAQQNLKGLDLQKKFVVQVQNLDSQSLCSAATYLTGPYSQGPLKFSPLKEKGGFWDTPFYTQKVMGDPGSPPSSA